MNRAQRRAFKLAKKARKPVHQTAVQPPTPEPAAVETTSSQPIPEPGAPFPSLAQLTANRANAQLSTGPKTSAGLAISSQNRTTHGLARHNGAFRLLASEDPAEFESLKQLLAAEHQPETETESILIQTMAESHWLANRAQSLQDSCFDPETGQIANEKSFSLYLRYQTAHKRHFHKSLNDLAKLRSERRKAQIGFEAQKRQEDTQRIKNEQHEMKKQVHYWNVLRKDAEACHQIGVNTLQYLKGCAEHPGFAAQYAAELATKGVNQSGFCTVPQPAAA